MDFLISMDDFPELSRGESTTGPSGLAQDPPSDEPRTPWAMPELSRDEVAEPTATVVVTAVDEPDAPAPEVVPVPFGPIVSNDDLPEAILLSPQEF